MANVRNTSLCSGPRIPFITARTLYGVQVRMNTRRIAERVFAAFLSCLFSWVAFFILFFLGRELAGRLAGWETLLTYLNENCSETLAWLCDYCPKQNTEYHRRPQLAEKKTVEKRIPNEPMRPMRGLVHFVYNIIKKYSLEYYHKYCSLTYSFYTNLNSISFKYFLKRI